MKQANKQAEMILNELLQGKEGFQQWIYWKDNKGLIQFDIVTGWSRKDKEVTTLNSGFIPFEQVQHVCNTLTPEE